MRDGENVARWKGHLVLMLAKPARVHVTTHRAAVPYKKLPVVISKLAKARGISALALRFAGLTAQRATAVSHATWAEIDLRTATWTVPVARSKTGRALRVALSPQAKGSAAGGGREPAAAGRGGLRARLSLRRTMSRSELH